MSGKEKIENLDAVSVLTSTADPSVSNPSKWQEFKDSFKRADLDESAFSPGMTEAERAIAATANSPMQKSLKPRHILLITLGGNIGTGLFVSSGTALRTGGPLGVLIGWIITGACCYTVVQAMAELTVRFPVAGSHTTFANRFIDRSFGFAVAWDYALLWLIVLPLELVAASMTIKFWTTSINPDIFVAIFYVFIVAVNFFGVKGYGEAEFVFSSIKIVTIMGFIILALVLICGGGPTHEYIGAQYWHDPGALASGFKGVCSVFVSAAMSYMGTEVCGLAAAESADPRKALPAAIKHVFWRILLFYIVVLLLVGMLVPFNSERLLGAGGGTSASPFVIAIQTHTISGLPSVMNAVIMLSLLSVGNSATFSCSRTICALAAQGMAPKIFAYVDRKGRPLYALLLSAVVGLFSFIAAYKDQDTVFAWLLSISGLSSIFLWSAIVLSHIRFRYAMKKQGRSLDELAYVSNTGVYGSYFGLLVNILIVICQFWVSLFPVGGAEPSPVIFFQGYLCVPLVLVLYLGHKIYKRNWAMYIRSEEMDLDTGRREMDLNLLKQEVAEERELLRQKPFWYRTYKFWC
ncbi:hypothetical protein LJB42_001910 [Komagataella kurtzmanii]|nr:hypothetical protein LJB42_001910 [Komagataella kurtzmanii]